MSIRVNLAYEKIKSLLPEDPGIYKYFDKDGTIIYIGKSKSLKKRVSSYFTKEHDHLRIKRLVSQIDRIEVTIVNTEKEALFLENSLIKTHQPKYNIALKDDKTYPMICVTQEPFPRVYVTRNKYDKKALYLGPFFSVDRLRDMLDFIKPVFQYRTCQLALNEKSIQEGKFKLCLEYHIGNCKGPCVGKQSQSDYQAKMLELTNIFRGRFGVVLAEWEAKMREHAELYEFEQAAEYKKQIDNIRFFQSKNSIVSHTITKLDVAAYAVYEDKMFVNYMSVEEGAIVHTQMLELTRQLDETEEEMFCYAISTMRLELESEAIEILVEQAIQYSEPTVKISIPTQGDKKKLLDLTIKNVKYHRHQYIQNKIARTAHSSMHQVLETIKMDFRLKELPTHIECIDNSNFQGAYPVSAVVVFKNTKPYKKDYRIYNIKTVEGPNDFATMEEVIYRRYKRMLDENQPLPQLLIVDGGKGQLSSVMKSIEALGLQGRFTVCGIAKQLEEIFFPEDSIPLYIDKRSPSLKVIQHMRNEAHRFGITAHRARRSKAFTKSSLIEIEGIGEKTTETLLKHFKSVKKIKEATLEELVAVVGNSKAQIITRFLKEKNNDNT